MAANGIAHPSFTAMARRPSYRAPRARDLLHPSPFQPPQMPSLCAEERTLLDAVIASPDDDTPRLHIAAWYENNGQTVRATFIRNQIGGQPATPDPVWATDFEPWCARDLEYHRGFVESLSLSGRAFIALGEPLFRMTPLRRVRLVAVAPYIAELATCPWLNRLKMLDLRGNGIDPALLARDGLTIL